jgi:Abnormal spindle-like microcephaly-assoc'd, ASPM-SPD-2-Hydin
MNNPMGTLDLCRPAKRTALLVGALLVSVSVVAGSCQCGTEPPATEPPACVLDSDCPTPEVCRRSVCEPLLSQGSEGEGESAEGEGEGEGEVLLQGDLTVLPSGEVEFGAVRLGSAVERVITLRNIGTAALTITTIVIDDNDEATFAVAPAGNVLLELLPNEEVGLVLTHTPDDGLPNRSELKVLHNGTSSLLSVPLFAEFKGVSTLSVTSLPGELSPDITTIDFGVRPLGMSASTTIWVRNDGAADSVLGLSALLVTPENVGFAVVADLDQPRYLSAYDGACVAAATECPAGAGAVVCEQGACRDQAGQLLDAVPITVLYAPATADLHTATLTLRSDVGGVPDTATEIALSGVGAAGVLLVDPPMVGFERVYVGSSGRITVTARNDGGAALTLTNVSLRFANATFVVETPAGFPGFPYALAPAEQLPITIVFAPTFAGQFNNEIVWDIGDAGAMDASTPVVGNALLAPAVQVQTATRTAIDLDTGSIEFGDVPTGLQAPQTVRLLNGGVAGSVLHIVRMTIDGPQAGRYAMTPSAIASALPSAVNDEPHADLTITYLPATVTTVADQATLVIETDDPLRPTISLPMRGRATNPDITVSTKSIDFGPVLVGTAPSPTRTVTIRNDGFGALSIAAIAAPAQSAFTVSSSVSLPAVLPIARR